MTTSITEDTHTITAYYEVEGEYNAAEFDLNGKNLHEMIQDALEFWQEAPESHGDFEITSETIDDDAEIIIQGTVTNTAGDEEKTGTLTLHIEAEAK